MRQRLFFIFILVLILHPIGKAGQSLSELDSHVLKLDWEYKQKVPIYDCCDSTHVIAWVGHSYEEESPLGFLVLDSISVDGWLKVQEYREDRVPQEIISGFIHLENYIVITPQDYLRTQIFEGPSSECSARIVNTGQFSLSVKKYYKGWVYVSFYDASNQLVIGWIAPFSQCPLMFTTCN